MANVFVLAPVKLISAGDLSGNITTAPTVVDTKTIYQYQFNILSGSPTGQFFVDESLDYAPLTHGPANAGTWVAVPLSPTLVVTAGSPAACTARVALSGAYGIRARWVPTGSTSGTVDIWVSAKGALG